MQDGGCFVDRLSRVSFSYDARGHMSLVTTGQSTMALFSRNRDISNPAITATT
jgi:hypothetical protein